MDRFDAELRKLLQDMAETMYANKGIGLAAQQVGRLERVCVIDVPGKEDAPGTGLMFLVNPAVVSREGSVVFKEGCLSFPGLEVEVERAATVTVEYQDEQGDRKTIVAEGLAAVCLQHEIDHLDGVVFVDRLSPLKRRLALKEYARAARRADEREP